MENEVQGMSAAEDAALTLEISVHDGVVNAAEDYGVEGVGVGRSNLSGLRELYQRNAAVLWSWSRRKGTPTNFNGPLFRVCGSEWRVLKFKNPTFGFAKNGAPRPFEL